MTDIYSEIKSKIRAMQGKNGPVAFIAKVESTDGDTCTCSIGELKLTDVRLRAVVNGEDSQLLVTPKKGSYVTLLDLSGGDMRQMEAIAFSEIEKIEIKTSGDIAIDCDGIITLNGGDNHGVPKVEKVADKLYAIERDINQLKTILSGWTPVVYDGGAALKGATAGWAASQLQTTSYTDLENDKIKH